MWKSRARDLPRLPGWQWLTCPWPGGPATAGTAPGGPAHLGPAPRRCPGSGSAAAPSLMRRRSRCRDRTTVTGVVPASLAHCPRGGYRGHRDLSLLSLEAQAQTARWRDAALRAQICTEQTGFQQNQVWQTPRVMGTLFEEEWGLGCRCPE